MQKYTSRKSDSSSEISKSNGSWAKLDVIDKKLVVSQYLLSKLFNLSIRITVQSAKC